MPDHRGKFAPTYEGPYMIKKAFSRRALILVDMDGHDFNMPTNSNAVIRYFAWRSLPVHLIFIFFYAKKKGKVQTIRKYVKRYVGRLKTQKGRSTQKEIKRKRVREPARLKTQKGGLGKN